LALGLSEDDTIIRRRLAQKMEFLGEGLIDPGEPSEQELHTYLKAHSEQFQEPARISFEHVYLNPERRGEGLEQDAQGLLVSFQARDGVVDTHHAGDLILLDIRIDLASETLIANTFGKEFGQAMMDLSPGRWQGPVRSAYGLQVVYVYERQEGRVPDLNRVRDEVDKVDCDNQVLMSSSGVALTRSTMGKPGARQGIATQSATQQARRDVEQCLEPKGWKRETDAK